MSPTALMATPEVAIGPIIAVTVCVDDGLLPESLPHPGAPIANRISNAAMSHARRRVPSDTAAVASPRIANAIHSGVLATRPFPGVIAAKATYPDSLRLVGESVTSSAKSVTLLPGANTTGKPEVKVVLASGGLTGEGAGGGPLTSNRAEVSFNVPEENNAGSLNAIVALLMV